MTDFALINCYLQNYSTAKNSILCNYYIPIPQKNSVNQWIQTIYDYFPYENDYFYFRIKIIGQRLGWKGDNNYYWLDFSSISNDDASFATLVEDIHSIDLQVTLLDATGSEDIDYETVIIPEKYEEYLESVGTDESIFQREEISSPVSKPLTVQVPPRYSDRPPAYQTTAATTSPLGHSRPEDDERSSYADYGGSSTQPKPSSASSSSAASAININVMKKGVTSLWKTVKATADKLQSTVINATSGTLISQATQENLHHLSELVMNDFDYQNPFHLHLLQDLWKYSIQPLVSEEFPRSADADSAYSSIHWKQAGWQNPNIVKDLKTTGLLAIQSTVYFSQQHSSIAIKILQENRANVKTNYPFAIVAINLTLLLIELFSLRDEK